MTLTLLMLGNLFLWIAVGYEIGHQRGYKQASKDLTTMMENYVRDQHHTNDSE